MLHAFSGVPLRHDHDLTPISRVLIPFARVGLQRALSRARRSGADDQFPAFAPSAGERGIHQLLGPLLALDHAVDLRSFERRDHMRVSNTKDHIRRGALGAKASLDLRKETVHAADALLKVPGGPSDAVVKNSIAKEV